MIEAGAVFIRIISIDSQALPSIEVMLGSSSIQQVLSLLYGGENGHSTQ